MQGNDGEITVSQKSYLVKVSSESACYIPRSNPPYAFPHIASMLGLFQAASLLLLLWLAASVSTPFSPVTHYYSLSKTPTIPGVGRLGLAINKNVRLRVLTEWITYT